MDAKRRRMIEEIEGNWFRAYSLKNYSRLKDFGIIQSNFDK